MIGLLEHQIQTWDSTGEVWPRRIIARIRTTLKARIKKERGKRVERTEGYSNHEDSLSGDFGIDPDVDGSQAAGGLGDEARGHGGRGPNGIYG